MPSTLVPFVLMLLCALFAVNGFAAGQLPEQKKTNPSDALFATNAPICTFSIEVSDSELAALR